MDKSLTKIRHERSKKDFPKLKLDEDEYVEFVFRRSTACLLLILVGTALATIIILLAFLLTLIGQSFLDETGRNFMFIVLAVLLVTTGFISFISYEVFKNNILFVTNKKLTQKIMTSPSSNSTSTIDLFSVEDVSYHQHGILASLFNYGTLRFSTVGDETTYTFKFASVDSETIDSLVSLVSSAKKPSSSDNPSSESNNS